MTDVVEDVVDFAFIPLKGLFDVFKGDDDEGGIVPDATEPKAPGISDAEAQQIAKKRLFRSGTVFTNTLGEEVSESQVEGTRLI